MSPIIDTILWLIYLLLLFVNVFWLLVYFLNYSTIEMKRKKLKILPKVTIAIPVYNEEKVIELTMKSAINLDYPRDLLEIIIINNKSTDDTLKIARRIKNNNKNTTIKIININRKGKGLALNKALEVAKGKYFILFDADSFVDNDALKKLLPYFLNGKNIACVLPMMKVGHALNFLQKLQWYEYIMNLYYKRLMGVLDCVPVAPGPFSIYDTSILKKVGGFAHPNLTEDLEITLRLQKLHYKIIQTMDAEVRTIAPENVKDLYKQRNRWYKGTVFNTLSKNYRTLWFNKEYGDFGYLQMPLMVIPGLFAILILIIHTYYLFKNLFTTIFKLHSINYDIFTLISNWTLDINFLDGDYTRNFIAILMLSLGLLTFYLSHKMANESIFKYGKLPMISFLFLFPFFLSYVWTRIFIDLIFRRVQEW